MSSPKNWPHPIPGENDALEPEMLRMFLLAGWRIAENASEVELIESRLRPLSVPLPKTLDELAALASQARERKLTNVVQLDADAEQGLARAAREGSSITPEIEKRMQEDRNKAESDLDS